MAKQVSDRASWFFFAARLRDLARIAHLPFGLFMAVTLTFLLYPILILTGPQKIWKKFWEKKHRKEA